MYNVLFAGAHTLHCSSWAQLSAPYANRCYSCASLVCYSCANLMAEPCADCHVALPPPHSTIFSGLLRSVAFLPQAFRSQSIGFRRSRRTPSPTLLCAGVMQQWQAVQLPYRPQIHTRNSPSLQMLDSTLLVHETSV